MMQKKIMSVMAFTMISLSIFAQGPMGGGGFGGGRPPMGNSDSRSGGNQGSEKEEATQVVKFPDIPQLTLKQREKMISQVIKEHDAIAKLDKEKQTLFMSYMKPGQGQKGMPDQKGPKDGFDKPRNGKDSLQGENSRPPMPPAGDVQGKDHKFQQPKLSEKDQKKLDGIEKNVTKTHAKADKKYRSILTKEQYAVFNEKKNEIKFNTPSKGNRPQRGNRPQGSNGNGDNGGGMGPNGPGGNGGF